MLGICFRGHWGNEQPPDAAGAEKAARESLRLEPALYPKT
jgi:hypothetical protein